MNSIIGSRMADIEFSSISSFLQSVEARAELKQVSTSAIFSFRVPKSGIGTLIKQKQLLLWKLVENNSKLSIWVEGQRKDLDALELVVLRSMYVTTKNSIELVESHIERAKRLESMYADMEQLSLDVVEGEEDEPPF